MRFGELGNFCYTAFTSIIEQYSSPLFAILYSNKISGDTIKVPDEKLFNKYYIKSILLLFLHVMKQ